MYKITNGIQIAAFVLAAQWLDENTWYEQAHLT